ncbi:hypothetical protein [Deminuibacter soli]|uniref:Glycoside hydrolase family 65 n=1 Tax=Deminuibacter soli TaxID=2291815 RepID=A0A3E1NNH1_9BACT|nr:hypothetical protein [Deminuibacter soli]RFM29472.1 hypothetical protein DXN05_00350 [Deminuibacter soli]
MFCSKHRIPACLKGSAAALLGSLLFCSAAGAQKIDRYALVMRHTVVNTTFDSLSALTVGNGRFAFTVDGTGLQSFPGAYAGGIPLATQSEWGWHSFINANHYRREETYKNYSFNGKPAGYAVQWNGPDRNHDAAEFFRQNAHRLQLGNIGFDIIKKNGTAATIEDIHPVQQQLNLWTGEITSLFTVEEQPVTVLTVAHQERDAIAVRVVSPLLQEGRLKIRIRLPYPTGKATDAGNNWQAQGSHISFIKMQQAHSMQLMHVLDSSYYFIHASWESPAAVLKARSHYYQLSPAPTDTFAFSCAFTRQLLPDSLPGFAATEQNSAAAWKQYWTKGAAVDFTGSTDARALELERRVVLSQYLLKVQCAGHYPAQQTGLTGNSNYGKPTLDDHWWLQAQFALWGRGALLEQSVQWYAAVFDKACAIARRQGYQGARWPWSSDTSGLESPGTAGAFSLWQQAQPVLLAELCYRSRPDTVLLRRYKSMVFATADFMASYVVLDAASGQYQLNSGLPAGGQITDSGKSVNPAFELSCWYQALAVAQQWRVRCGLKPNAHWDEVMQHLAPLQAPDGVYLAAESAPDTYTNVQYRSGHPGLLGIWGWLPETGRVNAAPMRHTFNWVWYNWYWEQTTGWDFPFAAMAATRLDMPDRALEALFMDFDSNRWLPNGHNYQTGSASVYLPGNGALLAAIAMMCAGYDGCTVSNPGFPKNGAWHVRWEGLQRMP